MKETETTSSASEEINEFNGYELYNTGMKSIPTLLYPLLQATGLASVVGESDSGKSTFLRQLAICIALNQKEFLGFELNGRTNKVIYVSTEDDPDSIRCTLKQQVDSILFDNKNADKKSLENIKFIFDTHNLLENLKGKLKQDPVDLIIVDAFADVFDKEINSNTQVRAFLNTYDQMAKANKCLIIFLHHTTKTGSQKAPSKNSIIGSQGFEAKMRVVLQLIPEKGKMIPAKLIVLKANFLNSDDKSNGYNLEMSDKLIFKKVSTYKRTDENNRESKPHTKSIPRSKDPNILRQIKKFKAAGLTDRAIALKLEEQGIDISKSTVNSIVLENGFSATIPSKE